MAPTGVVRTQHVDHINVCREPQLALQATLFFIVKSFRELMITNLRNRFQERCKRAVRRSRRRIGPSCCRRARASLTNRRGKRSPLFAKLTGRRSTHSFVAAAIRRLTRKISSRVFSSIYSAQHVEPGRSGEGPTAHVPAGFIAKFSAEAARAHARDQTRRSASVRVVR